MPTPTAAVMPETGGGPASLPPFDWVGVLVWAPALVVRTYTKTR
jgi:hypothetical protein